MLSGGGLDHLHTAACTYGGLLLQWTIDNSLTIVHEGSVNNGEKIVGSEVDATFKKKPTKL